MLEHLAGGTTLAEATKAPGVSPSTAKTRNDLTPLSQRGVQT
jgi:hypothetical protein